MVDRSSYTIQTLDIKGREAGIVWSLWSWDSTGSIRWVTFCCLKIQIKADFFFLEKSFNDEISESWSILLLAKGCTGLLGGKLVL